MDTATKHRRMVLIASIVVFAALFALMKTLGRFAVEFRKRFGEVPSDVLARPLH